MHDKASHIGRPALVETPTLTITIAYETTKPYLDFGGSGPVDVARLGDWIDSQPDLQQLVDLAFDLAEDVKA